MFQRTADESFEHGALYGSSEARGQRPAPGKATLTSRLGARSGAASPPVSDRPRRAAEVGAAAVEDPFSLHLGAPTSGAELRTRFAEIIGESVQGVALRDDAQANQRAASLGARAFAEGETVFFGAGELELEY